MEMDAIFKTKDYEKAAKRLGEAQRSLHLLASSPDYLERKNLLLKLLNRLESELSPLLVSALNENDIEDGAFRFLSLISFLDRSPEDL